MPLQSNSSISSFIQKVSDLDPALLVWIICTTSHTKTFCRKECRDLKKIKRSVEKGFGSGNYDCKSISPNDKKNMEMYVCNHAIAIPRLADLHIIHLPTSNIIKRTPTFRVHMRL